MLLYLRGFPLTVESVSNLPTLNVVGFVMIPREK